MVDKEIEAKIKIFLRSLSESERSLSDDEILRAIAAVRAQLASADPLPSLGAATTRIAAERSATLLATTKMASDSPYPQSWEEAKAQVPGLRKWVEAKRAALALDPGRPVRDIVIEHLRNVDTGLGRWTANDGLPKASLRRIDESLRQELLGVDNLPNDIKLLAGSRGRPRTKEAPTMEQLREARRIASLGARRGL